MSVVITGIGTAVPPHHITQESAAKGTVPFCCETPGQGRLVEGLFRRAGVQTRHSVLLRQSTGTMAESQDFYSPRTDAVPRGPTTGDRMAYFERAAGELAIAAATQALERGEVDPRRVTHLITVTCSGFSAPGFDCTLIRELPLKATVARTQIGFMGCHAALNALRVARAFVAADPQAVVLVCCVELCSLHYQYGWDPEQIVAMSLFSDGAAACIVQSPDAGKAARPAPYQILAHGALLMQDCGDAMTWRMSDHGFRMTLSPRVPDLLARHLLPWLTEWLSSHGYRPEEIAGWAVHPGGPRILQAFTDATKLNPEVVQASREVLRRYGNMSSPTLIFILDALQATPDSRPTVAIGFGPGLAVEAALLG